VRKLLLADDSVTIQRVVELTFSAEDVQVVAVGDGEQAIARIPSERPDIVLADIGMPGRDGYEVASFVKTQPELAHIPVLLLAGAFEPVDEAKAEQSRCDGVLTKPFDSQQVIARVRELLDGVKGAPTHHTMGVPRAVARLSLNTTPDVRAADAPSKTEATPPVDTSTGATVARPADDPLDRYFDRLDEAFATLNQTPPRPPVEQPWMHLDDAIGELEVPTIDSVLGESRPSDVQPASMPTDVPPPAPPAAASGDLLADAFNALLAVEQGEPGAQPPRLATAADPAVTDALVEQVTGRVLARLAPDALTPIVREIVSEVSERLVREEIARIRDRR
jgi:CheY-like chemotaxis protein